MMKTNKTPRLGVFSILVPLVLVLTLLSGAAQAAVTLYVATTGSAAASYAAMQNSGSPGTYARAMYLAQPDDVIVLKPGIYDSTNLGATGNVGVMNFYRSRQTVRAQYRANDPAVPVANRSVIKIYDPHVYTPGAANLKYYSAIDVTSLNNITIDGFEIDGRFPTSFNGDTEQRWPNGIAAQVGASNITISNNVIHDAWGAGIGTKRCDYITVTRNVVYNCAFWSRLDTSGISLLENKARTSTSDTSFHNYIAYNRVYGNRERFTGLSVTGGGHTDGNGIIIDSFPANCPYTLIENNLCYDNGARGIHVFLSDNVVVRNNTIYKNCQDPVVQDAEFVAVGQNITYTNNIAYGTGSTKINAIRADAGNVPSTATFSYNLYFNYTTATFGNSDEQNDPLFFNASARDFRCGYNSRAVDSGNTANYAPFDFSGLARPASLRVDRGAFER